MSRTEKLYQRLDELESQYSGLLRKELEAVLRGEVGHYIGSQLREDWSRWECRVPDDRAIELEGLEKEIGKLRSKLGELRLETADPLQVLDHDGVEGGNLVPTRLVVVVAGDCSSLFHVQVVAAEGEKLTNPPAGHVAKHD